MKRTKNTNKVGGCIKVGGCMLLVVANLWL